MNILLTNDDGYNAPGILALKKALEAAGHKTLIVAPLENQSGKSHSVTLHGDFFLKKQGEGIYSINGTPADTVLFYFGSGYFKFKADMIVSGINNSVNLASGIIYSGTCGAASEGALHYVPSIAISGEVSGGQVNYEAAAAFLARHIEDFRKEIISAGEKRYYLNINVPYKADIEKYEYAKLNGIHFNDIIERKDEDDRGIRFAVNYLDDGFAQKKDWDFETAAYMKGCELDLVQRGIISLMYVSCFLTDLKK